MSEKKSDKIGEYPKNVDVPALTDRRANWTNWYLAGALGVSLLLNVAQAGSIFAMIPLRTFEPVLVQFAEKSEMFARIIPVQNQISTIEALNESLLRQYVTYRHSIPRNRELMRSRWGQNGFLHLTSTGTVFDGFRASVNNINKLLEKGVSREVSITRVSKSPLADNVYEIEFDVRDRTSDQDVINKQTFVATASITYTDKLRDSMTYEQSLVNPLGFQVTAYTLSEKIQK